MLQQTLQGACRSALLAIYALQLEPSASSPVEPQIIVLPQHILPEFIRSVRG